jgi:hypothetical protein
MFLTGSMFFISWARIAQAQPCLHNRDSSSSARIFSWNFRTFHQSMSHYKGVLDVGIPRIWSQISSLSTIYNSLTPISNKWESKVLIFKSGQAQTWHISSLWIVRIPRVQQKLSRRWVSTLCRPLEGITSASRSSLQIPTLAWDKRPNRQIQIPMHHRRRRCKDEHKRKTCSRHFPGQKMDSFSDALIQLPKRMCSLW